MSSLRPFRLITARRGATLVSPFPTPYLSTNLTLLRYPLGILHLQHLRRPRALLARPYAKEQEEQGR